MPRDFAQLSKFLSKYLRHAPHELGLTLQAGGWVSVDDLLASSAKIGFPITYDDLATCVETNDKQRFAFDDTGDLIRANQGHSVTVDLQLEEQPPPLELFHGTVARFLDAIFAEGLKKGRRHHVHLSRDEATARKVGARRGVPIILQVDSGAMSAAGFRFFQSANGVWLTDVVPAEYLSRLE
ncbi:MAG: RNA 2'-phosphotransferase [Planctomycetes bacterium]|nr:RNA 2'-phosphotransferase [Planctomycetota bacterium]